MKGPFDTEFIQATFKIIDREATTPGPKACRRRIHSMCEHMQLAYGSHSFRVINMIHDFMLKDLEERYGHNERIYSRLKDCQVRAYRYWIRRLEQWKKSNKAMLQ
jgi:hypothetical protein